MEKELTQARFVANLMDRQFKVGKVSFGIESLLGFIPGIGDIIGVLLALYIYRVGVRMGVGRKHRTFMLFNIILDFIIGAIPFIGDLFDIGYKANVRNLHILEKHSRGKYTEAEIVKK